VKQLLISHKNFKQDKMNIEGLHDELMPAVNAAIQYINVRPLHYKDKSIPPAEAIVLEGRKLMKIYNQMSSQIIFNENNKSSKVTYINMPMRSWVDEEWSKLQAETLYLAKCCEILKQEDNNFMTELARILRNLNHNIPPFDENPPGYVLLQWCRYQLANKETRDEIVQISVAKAKGKELYTNVVAVLNDFYNFMDEIEKSFMLTSGSLRIIQDTKDMLTSNENLVDLHYCLVCRSLGTFLEARAPCEINVDLAKSCLESLLEKIPVAA